MSSIMKQKWEMKQLAAKAIWCCLQTSYSPADLKRVNVKDIFNPSEPPLIPDGTTTEEAEIRMNWVKE